MAVLVVCMPIVVSVLVVGRRKSSVVSLQLHWIDGCGME